MRLWELSKWVSRRLISVKKTQSVTHTNGQSNSKLQLNALNTAEYIYVIVTANWVSIRVYSILQMCLSVAPLHLGCTWCGFNQFIVLVIHFHNHQDQLQVRKWHYSSVLLPDSDLISNRTVVSLDTAINTYHAASHAILTNSDNTIP